MIDIAHILDEKKLIKITFDKIMISSMKSNFVTRDRAKVIANNGLDRFVDFIVI